MRDAADAWNDNIERWVYATGGDLAQQLGVEGYYVRIAPPDTDRAAASPTQGFVPIKNRPPGEDRERAYHIISPDALALVRFGLRAPDDPRILNTIRVIDALLRVATAARPVLVSLQRRRIRRAQRWLALRRHRHRPPLAAAGR